MDRWLRSLGDETKADGPLHINFRVFQLSIDPAIQSATFYSDVEAAYGARGIPKQNPFFVFQYPS